MQEEIDSLSAAIDEINEELRVLHLREAVLKSRLNQTVDRKYRLVTERRHRSHRTNSHSRSSPTTTTRSTTAVDTDTNRDSSGGIPTATTSTSNRNFRSDATHDSSRKNTAREPHIVRDRDGVVIGIGDEVRFLTKGVNKCELGEVHKITRKFVFCIDNNDELTKRYPRNLRIINKYHEC